MPPEPAYLVAVDGPHRGLSWPIAGTVSIGREGDIPLDDPHLGRHQASIRWRGGRIRLRHDGGTNPTLIGLGPVRLACPSRWVTLPRRVRLELGAGVFRVEAGAPPVAREARAFPLR
ncbi:MAG TPA: FHA domain-containing protein, partial [Actinomycetales bacterium]|nr:FHA domain-containing protein [Actinomycetales bacterium]